MNLDQCVLFWPLAIGSVSCIRPTVHFNEEFERGLFKENADGQWTLNKRHAQYRTYWCEAFDHFARILFTQTPKNNLFYLGHTGDFQHWSVPAIDILAVVANGDPATLTRLTDVTSRLNQCLQGVPTSWKKNGVVPQLRLQVQNAHREWTFPRASVPTPNDPIGLLHPEDMRVLVGNTAWFAHRNQLSGLLMEPRLARCYSKPWTPVAVDILARGTHQHRLEFRRCWMAGAFPSDVLDNVCPAMVRFLHANDCMHSAADAWALALERFMLHDEEHTYPVFENVSSNLFLTPTSV